MTARARTAADPVASADHPFRGLTEGWQRIPRSRNGIANPQQPVQTCLEVVLEPERSAWVRDAASRMGVDYQMYLASLIDAARAADES